MADTPAPIPTLTVTSRATGPIVPAAGVEKAAWCFYAIAALGSAIGQIWVGAIVPPWPATLPLWIRVLIVLPFAIVIDLGGAVSAAMADWRQRLGETAYGWQALSGASVVAGVGINVAGHADVPYLAVVFGGLGAFAYTVWLLHAAARRRDALRANGKLHNTAPAYGLLQWKREPAATARARILALEHGYGVIESLTAARIQIAEEDRRKALASHIDADIRARHADPVLAAIAATATPVDRVADELMGLIDTTGWARGIAGKIQAPSPHQIPALPSTEEPLDDDENETEDTDQDSSLHNGVQADAASLLPAKVTDYQRWHTLWIRSIRDRPDATNRDLAKGTATSVRTIQRIRAAGAAGLLDSPTPPTAPVSGLAARNGDEPSSSS